MWESYLKLWLKVTKNDTRNDTSYTSTIDAEDGYKISGAWRSESHTGCSQYIACHLLTLIIN